MDTGRYHESNRRFRVFDKEISLIRYAIIFESQNQVQNYNNQNSIFAMIFLRSLYAP